MDLARYTVDSPRKVELASFSCDPPEGAEKEASRDATKKLGKQIEEIFDKVFFAGMNGVLIVLQGMDAAGKDGTIRHILGHTHAQSCRVASFKVPTPEELSHDFLWRCHAKTPGKGEIVVFNRSHYEDVGVVRVHGFVPDPVWRERYGQINDFEETLARNGTVILKFWLHITSEEQEERLRDREDDPDAAWKLSVGDWKERAYWDGYQEAYSEAVSKCSARHAPWVVVPANKKWFRDHVVSAAIVERLSPYLPEWESRLEKIGEAAKAELAEYRASQ